MLDSQICCKYTKYNFILQVFLYKSTYSIRVARAARVVRALCARCAGVVRARVSVSAGNVQVVLCLVLSSVLVRGYPPARGEVSPRRRGRSPKRGRERGASRPNRAHTAGAERARAREGEGRSDRTSRPNKGEGAAPGAPAGAVGGGYPLAIAKTRLQGTTRVYYGGSGWKFHCRTTLRHRGNASTGTWVYKRKDRSACCIHKRNDRSACCIYKRYFTFVKGGEHGTGTTTAPEDPTRKPNRPTERDEGRSGATP